MGYSSPKKQLDLNDFLSQPAKKLPFKRYGLRHTPTKPAAVNTPANPQETDG